MRILLANPRGFCAGVNMAIDCVRQVLATLGPPVYVYHEIVHNRHVVEEFRGQGVTFVDELEHVPPGSVIVYSAHGVSPEIRRKARERRLVEVDATCPLVIKVHLEVLRFARQGFTIIFVGHRRHDEAVGTVGEAPGSIIVVETPEEAAKLQIQDTRKLAYVTQTTLSVSDAQRIIAVLQARFPQIRGPGKDDICYATTNRQAAVRDLAPQADVVLVIGSANSSNSRRLVETAEEAGARAHLLDDESHLDPAWMKDAQTVMITAGASAPEHLVNGLIDRLRREYGADVESRTVVEERMHFELPRSARDLAARS